MAGGFPHRGAWLGGSTQSGGCGASSILPARYRPVNIVDVVRGTLDRTSHKPEAPDEYVQHRVGPARRTGARRICKRGDRERVGDAWKTEGARRW